MLFPRGRGVAPRIEAVVNGGDIVGAEVWQAVFPVQARTFIRSQAHSSIFIGLCRILSPDLKSNVFKRKLCNETLIKMHRVLAIGKGSCKPRFMTEPGRFLIYSRHFSFLLKFNV